MARKRKGLGSSAAVHTAEAAKAAREIEHNAEYTVTQARSGKCASATISYAEMQQAIGRFEAHQRSGGKGWKPVTSIREAAAEYNDRCVRESGTVSGTRRRKGVGAPRRKKPAVSQEVKDLQRRKEQLFQAMGYAGNTAEQVRKYHAEIDAINAKLRTIK